MAARAPAPPPFPSRAPAATRLLAACDRLVTAPRVRLLAIALLSVNLLTTLGWVESVRHGVDGFGQPFGGDFIIFYAASKLALHGHALMAFDPHALLLAERSVITGTVQGLMWCYPPPFLLLVAPLALLPFSTAYVAFLAVTAAPWLLLMRRIGGTSPWVLVLTLAFMGAFVNAWQGQNGFLTAGLLGWGLVLADRRPWLAGALLGLLVYKPQFGLLAPLLLAATGNWRAFAGAGVSALAFIGLSTAAFGLAEWAAFLHALPMVSGNLMAGRLPWSKMPSVLVGLRTLGASPTVASTGQAAVSAGVATMTLIGWRRTDAAGRSATGLKAALAVLGSLLVSPYLFNYDLVLLAVPIALMAVAARDGEAPAGTLGAAVLAAFLPQLSLQVAAATHVQIGALGLLALFAACARALWTLSAPRQRLAAAQPRRQASAAARCRMAWRSASRSMSLS